MANNGPISGNEDLRKSVVRTVVPLVAGFIITLLLKVGFNIDTDTVVQFVYGLTTAVYYIVARFIEERVNSVWLSRILLGSSKRPTYDLAA